MSSLTLLEPRLALTVFFSAVALSCSASSEDPFGQNSGSGAANGGGNGFGFGGGAATTGGGFGDPTMMRNVGNGDCVAEVRRGEQIPLDMHIMFDQSLSMSCAIPSGGDRWTAVKNALTAFVSAPEAAGIGVGIQYFGDTLLASCDPAVYEVPDVEIGLLPGNGPAIVDSLNSHAPSTNTPTAAGLSGAINHAIAWRSANPSHTVIVVLVTDGQPNTCGNVTDVATVAGAALTGAAMPTYVVGVVSPGSDCGILDPNPPNVPDLDTVAAAGGTQRAFIVDTSGGAEQQFLAKMNEIRAGAVIPCDFQLPPPPPGETLNLSAVNVEFIDANQQSTLIYYVETPDRCDPAAGGWFYDNPQAPTRILLCQSTCSAVEATMGGQIDIALGCGTVTPPM